MNTQRLFLVLIALVAVAFTAVPALADAKSYDGTISSVGDGSLVLKGEADEHTFTVGDDITITLDGQDAEFSDLKAGQSATVMAEEKDGNLVASSIQAKSA